MKTMSKAIAGTIAACAMALPAVTPASAHDGYGSGRDGYDYARAGYGDRGYDQDREGGFGFREDRTSPREAIERCTRAAYFTANRYGYTAARVTEIRNVERNDRGYTIKAGMSVDNYGRDIGRDWHRDWHRDGADYGRGWNSDYRNQNNGWFRCKVAYGRVVDLDFGGIRGL